MKHIPLLLSTFSFVYVSIASNLIGFGGRSVLAQTAGCGSGSSTYLLKILSPVGSNQFRVACNEHDACYDTFGKSQQECDNSFHNRMLGICASDHNTIVGRRLLRPACNARADAYYAGVRKGGAKAYRDAQASAKPPGGLSATDIASIQRVHNQVIGGDGGPLYVNAAKDNEHRIVSQPP